ncbi:MAG TPA: hypothetical protein PK922_14035 [Syntrophorhabdus sp.]|jgi:hypothetical protein|nr:hypothetical protein [Syntrophorhabdus sp.]
MMFPDIGEFSNTDVSKDEGETVKIDKKQHTSEVKLNRRKAIREICLTCSAWSPSEVENCHFTDCPLFPYRTGKGKQNPKDRNKSIKSYCTWCSGDQIKEVRLCPSVDCPLHPFRLSGKNHQNASLLQKKTIYEGVQTIEESNPYNHTTQRQGVQ